MKQYILIITIIITFIIGLFLGYLSGRLEENSKYAHILEDGHKWRDKNDSLKDRLHIFELDLKQKTAALSYLGYHEIDTFYDTVNSEFEKYNGNE